VRQSFFVGFHHACMVRVSRLPEAIGLI
jgi:hypothetical protein